MRQVPRGEQRRGLAHRRGQRKVARRHDPDGAHPRRLVDLRVIRTSQARRADHDRHAGVDRGERISFDHTRGGVVDQHIDAIERVAHVATHRETQRLAAERYTEILTRRRATEGATEREIARLQYTPDDRAARPPGGARDTHR